MQPRSGPMPDEWSGTFIHKDLKVNGTVQHSLWIIDSKYEDFYRLMDCGVEPTLKIWFIGSIWWEIDFLEIHSRVIKTSFLGWIGPKNKIVSISLTSSCTDYVISGHRG